MYKNSVLYTLFFFCLTLFPFTGTFAQDNNVNAQTVVHLLNYVSMDYSGAVENGEIIDEEEFEEQVEFSNAAFNLINENNFLQGEDKERLANEVKTLLELVEGLKSEEEIREAAQNIVSDIIRITGIKTAPKLWPDIDNGSLLYAKSCATCHGTDGRGDGPGGAGLDPAPSSFHNAETMDQFSPFQAYNSIRLGVPGTGMVAFTEFNDEELWDLAFYVKSLRFAADPSDSLLMQDLFKEEMPKWGLEKVATLSDADLLNELEEDGGNGLQKLRALRLMPIGQATQNSLSIAVKDLEEALEYYKKGDKKMARIKSLSAYLEGIEPAEPRLKTIDNNFVLDLEHQMLSVRQAIEKDHGVEVVSEEITKALALISEADDKMKGQHLSYWLVFLLAGSIFLREGLEAFLILAIVLTLIKRSGANKALPWLHGGWITAVIFGIIGWILSDYVMQLGGKNRELMEGIVALLAVVILLWAGFWLHDKSHAQRWTKFITEKVGKYLERDHMIGLAAFSFMVVFREAFEVILFLRAIDLETAPESKSALALGVLAAVLIIGIFAYVFMKYSKLLPVRQLFKYSSYLIILLAAILLGKGIHALQEAGIFSVNTLPSFFRMEWLGIYPTLETTGAQVVLVLLIIITMWWRNGKIKKETTV